MRQKAFTLIELLIVIAIIAIISAVVFVALDPLTRFQDARDSTRFTDTTAILDAAKIDQIDRDGSYVAAISALTAGDVYMIGTTTGTGCNLTCDVAVTSTAHCVNLDALATGGYIASVPISPTGVTIWSAGTTGYTLQRDATGILHVRACESENTDEISIAR